MAFSMINQILQELQVNGTDDVPKSVKSLEHLCKKFQNPALLQELYSQSEDNIIAFSKLACSTYLFFLSSAKLARALDKVFKLLPSVYVKNINKEIEKELCQLLSQSNQKELKLLSSLLEQNSWAQSCVKKFFPELTKLLLSVLHLLKFGDKSKWTLDDLEHNHYVFKIIIQVEQLFQVEIKNLFNTRSTENKFHTSCLKNEWEQIIGALLQLFLQTSNRDILILIGTAISMSLNLSMPINCIGSIYMDLIDLLSKEKRSFMFGNVNICCREQDCEINDQSNHTLAIIKGLLVCCDARILSEDGGHLMLHIYPPLIKLCLGSVEYQYLAFQTLSLWYQKLALLTQEERRSFNSYLQILDQTFVFEDNFKSLMNETFLMSSSENVDKTLLEVPLKDLSHLALFSVNCPILRSTLSCIWLNWDSPVSGVPEYVAVIFSTLLSVWHSTCEKQSGCRQVCDILLQHVLSSDTQSKAKYRPLALLIPYIDGCKLIQGNLPLRDELISCMKFNHLAAIATDIYKAFIEQLQLMLGKKCITQWKQLWMPALITGLTSEDSLQRSKTCTYWLAPTLRIIPNSHTELLNSLEHYFHAESKSRMKYLYLFGWVNVLRFLRELICVPFPIMSIKLLKQALSCPHDDVRSEALLVICCTVKRAEPLSEVEMDLLKAFIPNNLKTDCAQFRHCLVSGLRKVLVRIRDSCLTAVNKKKTDEDFLDRSLNFLEWLYEVIMLSLSPGSSYQCRRTAVDILTAILETLIFDENETSKKGKAQESSETLIRYVHSKSMWNFFSDPNFVTVLTCLEDGAREIQSLCYNLLDKYFKWQRDEADIHAKVPHLYKHASALLSSPRAYETHTGILIMSLIFKKYVLDMGITLTSSCQEKSELHFQNEDSSQLLLVIKATDFQPIIAFMDLLIRNINNSLDVVLDNLASGFKSHPIHGWISCVTQILTDVSKVWSKDFDSEAWSIRLQEIYKLNQAVIILMLDVMAGGKALDNCPSFAEMGKALSTLVEQDDEEELLSISPSFQLLLSWCWINIKESCACLGELTHVVLLHSDKQLLPMDVLYNIGQIFVKVLTTCRHRGAIEGCRDGFFLFSHSLLSSHDPYLNNIPRSILAQILGSLSENSLSSSVTRRSAGLPIIVQIIVQAAHKSRNSDLLASSVDQLYKLANIPLPPDPSQLQDLSQSHALNILKVIFCDALLAPLLMSQLSKMTILVIEGFDSPSWAIRNAATQLISTLITRILGQKNQFKSSMTLAEFGALYPELLNYLVCKLELTSTKSTSLYIVLTIMSKLSSAQSYQQEEDLCTSLQSSISSFMSNPVHSLRKLSAKAFVTLSPFDKMKDTLDSILLKVQHKPLTKNELHGWLLCIQNFLLSERASSDVVLKVVDFLLINSWLFSYTPCLMISRAVMDIVQTCLTQIKLSVDSGEKLWSVIKILMKTMTIPVDHVQVDGFHCFRTCLKTLLSISTNSCSINDDFGAKFLKILNESLSSPLDDLRVAALDCLEECLASGHLIPDFNIQKTLLAQLFKENTAYHLIKIADIILKLKMNDLLSHDVFDVNIDILLLKRKWAHNASFTQVLFTIEGLIFGLAEDVHMIDCLSELCFWSEHLINISHPSVNESSRLLAAQALCIAGKNILEFCCRHTTLAGVDDAVTRIIRASVLLLEDTESEVREFAAKFICQFESETSYHYTLCYSILTRLIVRLSWCNSLMSELLDILFTPGHLSDSLKVCLDDKLQQLFEPELTSAFSEPHKLQIWASNTLELLTEHESFSRMLKIKMNATLAELTLKKIELHENAIRNVIFNASCNSRLMSTMLGIILLSHLYQTSLKHQPASKSEEGDKLCECVIWLQQIVSLHPLLRKSQLDLRQLMPLSLIE